MVGTVTRLCICKESRDTLLADAGTLTRRFRTNTQGHHWRQLKPNESEKPSFLPRLVCTSCFRLPVVIVFSILIPDLPFRQMSAFRSPESHQIGETLRITVARWRALLCLCTQYPAYRAKAELRNRKKRNEAKMSPVDMHAPFEPSSSRRRITAAVLTLVLIVSLLFLYSVQIRRPWFGTLAQDPGGMLQWLSGHTLSSRFAHFQEWVLIILGRGKNGACTVLRCVIKAWHRDGEVAFHARPRIDASV